MYAAAVQEPDEPHKPPLPDAKTVATLFGERVREFREQAELTQQQLSDRLRADFGIKLDTSAITRIENGSREPRLREAIAMAELLQFGLYNLNTAPPGDLLDYRLGGMNKLIDQSREMLVKLLHSVDRVAEAYQQEPYQAAGYPSLNDIIQDEITVYRTAIDRSIDLSHAGIFNSARTVEDAEIKREILNAVTYRIINDDDNTTDTET
jgi:transcriptional regulator with XRE-family HTH domain